MTKPTEFFLDILKKECKNSSVTVSSRLNDIGLDSLSIYEIILRGEEEFGYVISDETIEMFALENKTVKNLIDLFET